MVLGFVVFFFDSNKAQLNTIGLNVTILYINALIILHSKFPLLFLVEGRILSISNHFIQDSFCHLED